MISNTEGWLWRRRLLVLGRWRRMVRLSSNWPLFRVVLSLVSTSPKFQRIQLPATRLDHRSSGKKPVLVYLPNIFILRIAYRICMFLFRLFKSFAILIFLFSNRYIFRLCESFGIVLLFIHGINWRWWS